MKIFEKIVVNFRSHFRHVESLREKNHFDMFFFAKCHLRLCKILGFPGTHIRFFLQKIATFFYKYVTGIIFPLIFVQLFTSQNWIYQIWIKIEHQLGPPYDGASVSIALSFFLVMASLRE